MNAKNALQAGVSPLFLVALALSLSGCRAVELVFKAGAWSAVIVIVIAAAIAFGVIQLFRRAT